MIKEVNGVAFKDRSWEEWKSMVNESVQYGASTHPYSVTIQDFLTERWTKWEPRVGEGFL